VRTWRITQVCRVVKHADLQVPDGEHPFDFAIQIEHDLLWETDSSEAIDASMCEIAGAES
jgi:hypothetical protein